MANFFKGYQAELKRKREEEHAQQLRQRDKERRRRDYIDGLKRGEIVRYSTLVYAGTETPANVQTLYFVSRVSPDSVLLSDNRKEALNGYRHLYSICGILTD